MPTKVPWADEGWNVWKRCYKISPGCAHCYAERNDLAHNPDAKPWVKANAEREFFSDRIDLPRRVRQPRTWFVNVLSDFFDEFVGDDIRWKMFMTMRDTPRHRYLILTKRIERLHALRWQWPDNVWFGASVESPRYLDRLVRLSFRSQEDESFFGLGERFNALNQRGNVMDICCYEQYKSQGKRTYIPIPFLLSSAGYALFVDSHRWMQFDLASSGDCWSLEANLDPQQELRLQWFSGDDALRGLAAAESERTTQ